MGRIAPAITPPLPAKGLAIELVEASGNWSPPKGVTSVMMELNGAGQGGGYWGGSGSAYGGQAGDILNRVVVDVTEATVFQVVVGTGGTKATSAAYGNVGGDTTVTVKGVTHTALGGGKTGNRRGNLGQHIQAQAAPTPPPYSILLGFQSTGLGPAASSAAGGCSPLGVGEKSGVQAGLGAGGAPNSLPGGNGYVLFGYYLP